MPVLTAALITPDGRLAPLQGEFKSDPASIAALGHAVHAAGNELALRTGAREVQSTTLRSGQTCLTLLPVAQGVLVLEHAASVSAEAATAEAATLLPGPATAGGFSAAPPLSGTLSLADALHATAP